MHVCLRRALIGGLLSALLLWSSLLGAQRTASSAIPGLSQLLRTSGYIFSGTVRSVQRIAPTGPNEVATMQVTFEVTEGIRGVRTGQTLVIREWAGLWESGARYRPGQHILLFLYRPSRLGLTSTVGGQMGRFPIDNKGQVMVQQSQNSLSPAPGNGIRGPGGITMKAKDLVQAIRKAEKE